MFTISDELDRHTMSFALAKLHIISTNCIIRILCVSILVIFILFSVPIIRLATGPVLLAVRLEPSVKDAAAFRIQVFDEELRISEVIVGRRRVSHRASIAARIGVGGRRRRRLKFAVHPPNQRFVLVDKLFNGVPAFSHKRNC